MNLKEKTSRELVCFKAKQRLFSLHEQSMNLKREKCLDNSGLCFHELNKKLVVNIPQLISQHQEEFIAMLNSPNEPGDAAPRVGAPSAQGRPGQERAEMVLNVTAQEKEAIERVGECVMFVMTVVEKSTVQ